MRSRTTYVLLAVLIVAIAGVWWQKNQHTAQQTQRNQRQVSLALQDTGAIDRISIRWASSTVELVKRDSDWVIENAGNIRADAKPIDALLQSFKDLKVISVAATAKTDPASLDSYALYRTELTFAAGGETVSAYVLRRPEDYYGTAYAQRQGDPTVYLVESIPVDVFTREDWRDKTILRFAKDEVAAIKYVRNKQTFTLTRSDSSWLLDGKPALQSAADLFADNLGNLNALDFAATSTDFKPSGITIGITLKDREIGLTLGQTLADESAYLKTSDGKMYLLANTNVIRLTKTRKDFTP
ncbi:MAG: DUF4340 domain-containing protein [Patescibacteria group bacterium]|nr:DUF4340 domain-containing protein [Patescibacteria group bacterium]